MRLPRLILACSVVASCSDDVDPLDSVSAGTPSSPQTTANTGEPTTAAGSTSDATAGGSTTGDATTGDATTGAASTSSDATATTGDDPTATTTGQQGGHAADIQPIWDANCIAFCHEIGGSAQSYALLVDGHGALVGQPSVAYPSLTLVTPGSRDGSYLWHKLNGTQAEAGGGGSKMPLAGTLSADDLARIGEWIDQGALP